MKAKASITEHRRNLLERFRRSLQIVFLTVYSISAMAEGNEGWHFTPRPPVADDSAEILDRQDEPVPCEGTENDGGDEIAELPTQEIRELAYGLENSPLKIFNYVRDTIEYVHYFGAKKGAQLTLLEKSGNDFDQCALLVALLRQAATNVGGGFSARYQFGAMKVPYESLTGDNLKDWMGFSLSVSETNDDEIFQMVNSFNYQRGYPLLDNIDLYCYRPENLDYEFVFQRIWVELTWGTNIYLLDPSVKRRVRVPGIALGSAMQFNIGNLLSTTAQGATKNIDYVESLNWSGLSNLLSSYTGALITSLNTGTNANRSPLEVLSGTRLLQQEAKSLPTAPTFQVMSNEFTLHNGETKRCFPVHTWRNIPSNFCSRIELRVDDAVFVSPFAALQGGKLSITFASGTGYAEIRVNDEIKAAATSGNGDIVSVTNRILHPYGKWDAVLKTNIVLDTWFNQSNTPASQPYFRNAKGYTILYGFDDPKERLTRAEAKLDHYIREGFANDSAELVTQSLEVLGLNWLQQTYRIVTMLGAPRDVEFYYAHRVGRAGQQSGTISAFFIDVGMSKSAARWRAGGPSSATNPADKVMNTANLFMSALEHSVLEQLQGYKAASTIKCLYTGGQIPERIVLATQDNWTTVQTWFGQETTDPYNSADIAEIGSYVSSGFSVLVPTRKVNVDSDWKGFGYLARYEDAHVISFRMNIKQDFTTAGGFMGKNVPVNPPYLNDFITSSPIYFQPTPIATEVQKSFDPVNMADGSFLLSAEDLKSGADEPRGISFSRYYNSNRRNSNRARMGNGWTHNQNIALALRSDALAGTGEQTAQQMASTVVALEAALEVFNRAPDSTYPQSFLWTTACLIAEWGVDQLNTNAVSIEMGNETVQFIKQPVSGGFTYVPPAGITMSLTKPNGYVLQERHGNTFNFDASSNRVTSIVDPHGKTMTFNYLSDGKLNYVQDAFSRRLTFGYTGTNLTSVQEGTSSTPNQRSIGFGYQANASGVKDLVSFTDPEGKVSTFEYDGEHKLLKTKDAYQRVIVQNFYDSQGRVTNQYSQGDPNRSWKLYFNGVANVEEDPLGGQKTYFYDEKNRSTGMMDALGNRWTKVYDGQDHVVREISPKGETNWFEIDGDHNLRKVTDPLGEFTGMTYDSEKRLHQVTDKRGKVTTYFYNNQHQVTKIVSPPVNNVLSNVVEMNYFSADGTDQIKGALDWQMDQEGNKTWFKYDAFGNVKRRTLANNDYETFESDYRGQITRSLDFRGMTNVFEYNRRGQLTNSVAPGNVVTKLVYDDTGLLLSSEDPLTYRTGFTNSATGKLLRTWVPIGGGRGYYLYNQYDARDWLEWAESEPEERMTNILDAAGRLEGVTDPLERTIWFGYDENGARVSETSPLDVTPPQTTLYDYNPRGQLVAVTNALGDTVRHEYDENGAATNLVNRRGLAFRTDYYDDGRVWKTVTPAGKVTEFSYNKRGLLAGSMEPSGQTTALSYDFRGLLTNRVDGARSASMTYDDNGNLLTLVEGTKTIARMYDALNRMTNYSYVDTADVPGSYTLSFEYDKNGNLTKLVYPDGRAVTYGYDAGTRLTRVTDWKGRVTSMNYQGLSRIATIFNANGTRRKIEYDAAGHVLGIADEYPGVSGNRPMISYSGYGYDEAGRIADEFIAPIPSGYTEPTLSMSYDADNRLASFNGLTVTHDEDGNMVQGPLGSESLAGYGYDARNRLVSVSKPAVISNPTFSDGTTYHNHVGTTNQSYGPVNVRVGGEHGVAGVAAGSVRDNYDGWVGCQFTVGAVPVTISELGRWVLAGNTGTHVVKLVDSAGLDVPGGSTTVNTAGKPANQFAYGALPEPLTLPTNTVFYLVTRVTDTIGSDEWCDRDSVVTSTSLITVNQAAFRDDGVTAFQLRGGVNNCYGPVSLRTPGSPLVTAVAPSGAVRNNYPGWVGLRLEAGGAPMTVTEVGRWVLSGNSQDHAVKIVTTSGVTLGSANVRTAGASANGFAYAALPTPVTLSANTAYYVLSQEFNGGDQWLDYNSTLTIPGSGTTAYGYDPSGNRLKLAQDGETTRFAVNPNAALSQVLVRTRPDGSKTFYVYGAGLAYEVNETAAGDETSTLTYHYDIRGSTVALTDQSGVVRARYEYSPYGQVTKSTYDWYAPDTPFLYNGKYGVQTDANGLCYMRARYYNPHIRRFVNADPIGMAGGLNWYAYADGNPISMIDPFGLAASEMGGGSWLRQGISMGIGAAPFVGTLQSIVELGSGRDYITGEPASRGLAAAGIVAGIVPGGKTALKGGANLAGKLFGHSDELVEAAVKAAPNTTSLGITRNNPADWRVTRDLWDNSGYGDILSDANRAAIARGRTPVVDQSWIRHYPEDAGLVGERISMHHIGGGPITVPLPFTRHVDAHMPGGFGNNPGGPGSSLPIYPPRTGN